MKESAIYIRINHYEVYNSYFALITLPFFEFGVKLDMTEEEILSKKDDPRWFLDKALSPNAIYFDINKFRADGCYELLSFEGEIKETTKGTSDCVAMLVESEESLFLFTDWVNEYSDNREKYIGTSVITPFQKTEKNLSMLNSDFTLNVGSLSLMYGNSSNKTAGSGYSKWIKDGALLPEIKSNLLDRKRLSFVF